jgi:predicted PurR-regulated permease PerM
VADRQTGRGIAAGVVAAVAAGIGLYLAREVFIPIALALLFYALLRPLVRWLQRVRVPAPAGATAVVLALLAVLAGIGIAFSAPVGEWAQKAPQTLERARAKLQKLEASLPFGGSALGAAPANRSATGGGEQTGSSARRGRETSDAQGPAGGVSAHGGQRDPQQPAASAGSGASASQEGGSTTGAESASQPSSSPGSSSSSGTQGRSGPSSAGAAVGKVFGTTASLLSGVVEVVLLLLFLLAMGDRLKLKVLRAIRCWDDRRTAATVADEVEAVVSRYIVATALINLGQGVVVALAVWALGLPTPALWGLLTFVMEFIPYLGALVMILLLAVAGLTASDSFGHAMLAPAAYLVITTLQNNLVSPLAYGNRLKLSPAAILIAVMVWWLLWGFAGAFVAVPILAAVKVLADHVDALKPVGELIGD